MSVNPHAMRRKALVKAAHTGGHGRGQNLASYGYTLLKAGNQYLRVDGGKLVRHTSVTSAFNMERGHVLTLNPADGKVFEVLGAHETPPNATATVDHEAPDAATNELYFNIITTGAGPRAILSIGRMAVDGAGKFRVFSAVGAADGNVATVHALPADLATHVWEISTDAAAVLNRDI